MIKLPYVTGQTSFKIEFSAWNEALLDIRNINETAAWFIFHYYLGGHRTVSRFLDDKYELIEFDDIAVRNVVVESFEDGKLTIGVEFTCVAYVIEKETEVNNGD